MRVVEIGDKLPTANFLVTYNSACQNVINFWDDSAATVPSDLSNVTAVVVEVKVDAVTTLTWTGSIVGNVVTFNLTAADTTLTWDARSYVLVFTKSGARHVSVSGEVVVQR